MKEPVNKFNLEAAFKALDDIDIPVVKGLKASRLDLKENLKRVNKTDLLIEDYYNVNDTAELEAAQEEREAAVAKAKLARIEKIVDLDAHTAEDLLPSYVGKFIIQCPQCMTLFYKDAEDVEKSEDDDTVVNVNEVCQHCGNDSGYSLIGKVDVVGEEEADNYDAEDFDENELNLDFEDAEDDSEEDVEPEGEEDLTPEEEAEEEVEEEVEEEEVEEEVKESLQLNEDFNADKDALKDAINNAFENGDSKTEIANVIIDNIEEKDVEKIFDLLEKHLGNINLNQEQIQQIIDKLPEDCKEKAKAENWAKVKSICDFIDVTPELKNNPEAFLWVVKTVLLVAAVACPADGPVLDIIAAIIMLIPNNIIGKIWAALAQFNPIIAAAKLGSKVAGDKIEDNVEKAGLNDNVEESLNEELKNTEEGLIKDTVKGAIDGAKQSILGEDSQEEGLIGDTIRGAARGFLGINEEKAEEGLIGDTIRGAARGLLLGEDQQENEVEEGLITDTIRGAVKGFLGEEAEEVEEQLTEAVDNELQVKLDAHNDYINYIQEEILKEEKALDEAKNDFIKAAIQRRLDALKIDLENALPEEVKEEVAINEDPVEEPSIDEDKPEEPEIKESLTESINDVKSILKKYYVAKDDPNNNLGKEHIRALKDEEELPKKFKFLAGTDKSGIVKYDGKKYYWELNDGDIKISESLEEENYDVSDSEWEELLNSEEFKTPIHDTEVELYLDDNQSKDNAAEDELQEGILDIFTSNAKRADWLLQNARNNYKEDISDDNKLLYKGIQVWTYDIVKNKAGAEVNPSNSANKKVNKKTAHANYKDAVKYAENYSKISTNGIAEIFLIDNSDKPIIIARYFQGKLTDGTKNFLAKIYEAEHDKYKQAKAEEKKDNKIAKSDKKAQDKVNKVEGEVLEEPKTEVIPEPKPEAEVNEQPEDISEVCINGYITLYKVGTWKALKFASDANLEDIKAKAVQMSKDVKSEVKVNAKKVAEVKDFKNEIELLYSFKDGNLIKDNSKEAYSVLLKIKEDSEAPVEAEDENVTDVEESFSQAHAISIQEAFEDIEEFDTNSLKECIEKTREISNEGFILESCELTNRGCEIKGTFAPEDTITNYIFNEAYVQDNKLVLKGIEEHLNKNCTLYCSLNNNKDTIIAESFKCNN